LKQVSNPQQRMEKTFNVYSQHLVHNKADASASKLGGSVGDFSCWTCYETSLPCYFEYPGSNRTREWYCAPFNILLNIFCGCLPCLCHCFVCGSFCFTIDECFKDVKHGQYCSCLQCKKSDPLTSAQIGSRIKGTYLTLATMACIGFIGIGLYTFKGNMPIAILSFACSALILILAVNSYVADIFGRLFLSLNKKVDEDYKGITVDSGIPFVDLLKFLRLNIFLLMFAGLLIYVHFFQDDIYTFGTLGLVIVWTMSIRKVSNFLVDFIINTKTMRSLLEDANVNDVELQTRQIKEIELE